MKYIARIVLYSLLILLVILTVRYATKYNWTGHNLKINRAEITVYTDIPGHEADRYINAARIFREYFSKHFLRLTDKKLKIYIFGNRNDFTAYCKKIDHYTSPYSFYSNDIKLMVINQEEGGLPAAMHEFTHYFIQSNGYKLPGWVEEGLALFFEKYIGYYDAETDNFISFGYFNPWRFAELQDLQSNGKTGFENLPDSQSMAACFLLYLHKNNKLADFIGLCISSGDWRRAVTETLGHDTDRIEKDWKDWIDGQFNNDNVNFLEKSFLFGSKKEMESFIHSGKAGWSETEQVYVIGD